MKRFFALTGVLFFIVSVLFFIPGQGYAINPQPEPPGDKAKSVNIMNESYIGTIVKIEGSKITVRDDKGINKIVTSTAAGLKPGGKVKVTTKNGLTWLDPQPEPPMTPKTKPASR